jgi:hypothetical protein
MMRLIEENHEDCRVLLYDHHQQLKEDFDNNLFRILHPGKYKFIFRNIFI